MSLAPVHLEHLRSVCGAGQVLVDSTSLRRYGHDQTPEDRWAGTPDAVVLPATTAEVSAVLAYADSHLIPVTPRGAGSGLSGGAVPIHGGVVLSLERFNRVLSLDKAAGAVTVQPGVVTGELDKFLEPHGLFFPGYPMSEEICHIGGNIAENAGGGRAVKYGVTGSHVLGLQVVLASGSVLNLGGPRVKDVTGYDLLSLFVGSEGTLGVITEATLRVMPRPLYRRAVLALVDDLGDLAAVVESARAVPALSAVEVMDRKSLDILRETAPGFRDLVPSGGAYLLEVDGRHEALVARGQAALTEILGRLSPVLLQTADSDSAVVDIWKLRKQIPWAIKRLARGQSHEDVVVPSSRLGDLFSLLGTLELRHKVEAPAFGHAADGNIHVVPLRPEGIDDAAWPGLLESYLTDLYRSVVSMQGTISGEHGIGHKRREALGLALDDETISVMKAIKASLDPQGILNPGKIFPLGRPAYR